MIKEKVGYCIDLLVTYFIIFLHCKQCLFCLAEVEQKVALGAEVINMKTGKKAGKVTTTLGCCGLGVLRLEEAFKVSGVLTVQGQENVRVEAMRPQWWPAEWFREHQLDTAVA